MTYLLSLVSSIMLQHLKGLFLNLVHLGILENLIDQLLVAGCTLDTLIA